MAGAGKSLLATAILVAVRKKFKAMYPGDKFKLIWLTPMRRMRDDALSSVRCFLEDPLEAAAIGRPVDEGPSDVADGQFDVVTEAALRKRMEDLVIKAADLCERMRNTGLTQEESNPYTKSFMPCRLRSPSARKKCSVTSSTGQRSSS